jgi:hypothetical protein
MDRVMNQIKNLEIPLPARRLLQLEVAGDVAASGQSDPIFSQEVLNEMENTYNTKSYRFLRRFGDLRRIVESAIAFLPLLLTVTLIMEDETMVEFIREGGLGMYGIMAIGVLLFGRELLNGIRLLVIKDHSARNLQIDTPSVLLGCLALMLIGLGSTVLGLYATVDNVAQPSLYFDQIILGVKESITNLVLSSFLCALTVCIHYGVRRTLVVWHAVN